MKRKWLIRALLILLEAILVLYMIGGIITSPDEYTALLVFAAAALLVGYFIYRSFALPRPGRAYLARVEKTYAAYLTGVFEEDLKHRRALLAALAVSSLGAKPKSVWKRLLALLPHAKTDRERAVLLFFAARAATLAGDTDAARALYLESISCETQISSAYANLSVICQNEKDYTRAEEYVKAAIALDGESAVKHTNLANLYILMRRTEDARAAAKIALSKNDKAVDAYAVLALAAAMDKNKAEANRYARKCVDLGIEEAFITHLVSALLRGDMSVLAPAERMPAGASRQKTK